MSEDTIETTATEVAPPGVEDGAPLSIQDIRNALQIIDFAAQEGAFKGWPTITQVLGVRNRIEAFLATVPAEDAAASEGPAPASDELPPEAPAA